MNNKNEESKRAFVPKTIGDSLKKINRDISNKYGKIEYLIIAKWPKIVGQFFANHSEPNKISRIPDGENDTGDVIYSNYLHINVSPVAAVEFQHFKDKIIDKINSYFGYKAISNIRLKQNFIPKKNYTKQQNSNKNISLDKFEIKNINNKELEKSLVKLIQSINEKDQ
tara:strand:- start:2093 stop:2596 length:504 start_codon:yes stop_codon:yes gene_type:complete